MANIKRANAAGITKTGTAIPDVPDAPTINSATDVGTSRAYNNGAATVAFTAAATGGAVTSFTATSSPGGFTASGAASPLTVTGLASATAYTFTVAPTNATATGPTSTASSSVTATTVPQAPTIGTATAGSAGSGQATVAFTAGATGGSTITGYTATSSPGSITGTGSSSPITVTGLTNGTAYTFTVTATNANGTSSASSASNSITVPVPTFVYWTRGGSNRSTTLDKFNTNTETVSTGPTTVISRWAGATMSNTPTAGYFATGTPTGGTDGATTNVEKFTFSTESSSIVIASGAFQRIYTTGIYNAGTAGYYASGEYFSNFSNTGKVTYSNDTFSNISKNMASVGSSPSMAGMSNKGSAGYFGYGLGVSRIEKFTFSNETYSTIGNMGYSSYNPSGLSNSGTAGYASGGSVSGPVRTVVKVTFSNDGISNLGSVLSNQRATHSGSGIKGSSGFIANGGLGETQGASVIEKLSFSTDTVSVTSARTGSTGDGQFSQSVANEGSI